MGTREEATGDGHNHEPIRKPNYGDGINLDGSPLTLVDLAKSWIRPSAGQCTAIKNSFFDEKKSSPAVDVLKKDPIQVLPAKDMERSAEKVTWGGFEFDKDSYSGVMGTRPRVIPGEGSGRMRQPPEYARDLPEIYAQSEVNGYIRSHNQILDIDWTAEFKRLGIGPDESVTVMNTDAHPDMHRYENGTIMPKGNESIGNWGNTMILYPNVTEFIWVLPRDAKSDPGFRESYLNSDDPEDPWLIRSKADRPIYVNRKTGAQHWDELPEGAAESDYRTVWFRKRAIQDIPDMAGKRVLLTTDLDTFGLNDRGKDGRPELSTRGEAALAEYVKAIKDKNVRPFAHVTTISREFLEDSMASDLELFGLLSITAANNGQGKDALATYFRNRTEVATSSTQQPDPGDWHNGILTKRDEHPVLHLLQKLYELDRLTTSPDGALSLKAAADNQELEKALKITSQLFKTDEKGSSEILKRMALKSRFSANDSPDVIRHEWLAEMLLHVCQTALPKPKM